MTETLIGYARCSTHAQDLTAQRDRLRELGVAEDRIYLDHGLTGTTRNRPGLDQALAAVREGDTLVVPKLDRLARSVPDARAIGDDLTGRGIKLSLGGQVYDPADPMGKMFFNILATFAEFEVNLLRMRTREGMAAPARRASCAASSRSSPPGSSASWYGCATGEYSKADLAELFTVSARPCTGPSSEPRLQTKPGNQPEPLPCTPGTPHPNCRPGPPADHRYLAVILNVVFALDGAASPRRPRPVRTWAAWGSFLGGAARC